MFTGIVEEMGTVLSMEPIAELVMWDGRKGKGYVLVVRCKVVLDGCYEGASIAVNGTCLTVTSFGETTVSFGVAPETLRCTNLGLLRPESRVNMERSVAAGDRNSGHFVQGHVDATGTIKEKRVEGESLWVTVHTPPSLLQYIVRKGYIAVDGKFPPTISKGTSLTVCEVNRSEGWFNFMLVQFTQGKVIIPHKSVGDKEVDVLGKYVERSMAAVTARVEALECKLTDSLSAILGRLDKLEARCNAPAPAPAVPVVAPSV